MSSKDPRVAREPDESWLRRKAGVAGAALMAVVSAGAGALGAKAIMKDSPGPVERDPSFLSAPLPQEARRSPGEISLSDLHADMAAAHEARMANPVLRKQYEDELAKPKDLLREAAKEVLSKYLQTDDPEYHSADEEDSPREAVDEEVLIQEIAGRAAQTVVAAQEGPDQQSSSLGLYAQAATTAALTFVADILLGALKDVAKDKLKANLVRKGTPQENRDRRLTPEQLRAVLKNAELAAIAEGCDEKTAHDIAVHIVGEIELGLADSEGELQSWADQLAAR